MSEGAARPFGEGRGGDRLRVLVVAAYPAVRAGLSTLLSQDPGLLPAAPDPRPSSPADDRGDGAPAAVVVDLGGASEATVDELAAAYPGVPLVLLGGDPGLDGPGLGQGPVAYLAPDADAPTLIAAVRAVVAGLTVVDPVVAGAVGLHVHPSPVRGGGGEAGAGNEPLSARERQVLELVAAGLPNKAIARELGISEHTVKFHVGSVLGKLGAGSRTEAVMVATRRGVLAI